MKKLILLIAIVTGLNNAFAQTKEQVTTFLTDRTMPFNKGVKAVCVNNIDSAIRVCKKKDISYSHAYFTFYGDSINPSMEMGGSTEAIIKSKKVPFVMYKTYKENGNTIIETLTGNDSL